MPAKVHKAGDYEIHTTPSDILIKGKGQLTVKQGTLDDLKTLIDDISAVTEVGLNEAQRGALVARVVDDLAIITHAGTKISVELEKLSEFRDLIYEAERHYINDKSHSKRKRPRVGSRPQTDNWGGGQVI